MAKTAHRETGKFFHVGTIERQLEDSDRNYREFVRVPALSAGIYMLEADAVDTQSPHEEDEMYLVLRGRARMQVGEDDQAVAAGSLIFVPANMKHHFYDIQEALSVLVFFAPAET